MNRATRFGVSTLGAVALEPEAPANDTTGAAPTPQVKWLNVANEGEYLGHHQGGFQLNAENLQQLVDNLHAHPQYATGPVTLDGKTTQAGVNDVVQFDYEHASEMPPFEGAIPVTGAPAIGWVRDLQLRKDGQGRLQLWALAWLGDQIRGQIDRREYKWVSIAWNPNGVHWQTAKPIGAVLTSIAFTNHPFLQDLDSLAAASRVAGQRSRSGVQPRASSAEAHATSSTTPSRERATMELRVRLCTHYGLQPEANDDSIIRAAENAATTGGKLAALLQALGVQNADAAMAAVPELAAARAQLVDALAQLDSLATADAKVDETQVAPADIGMAASARGWAVRGMLDATLHAALLSHRKALIEAEIQALPADKRKFAGEQRLARDRGRKAFLAAYGVTQDPATQHLSQTYVAGPGAAGNASQFMAPQSSPVQLTVLPGGQPFAQQHGPQPLQLGQAPQQATQGGGGGINLSAFSGRNTTEKIIAYLATQDSAFAALEWGQKVKRAGDWRRQYEQQNGPIAA